MLDEAIKLFLAAAEHNWDDGTKALARILDDPACDRGTALMIFWRARPAYYAAFASDAEVPAVNSEVLGLLREVERRLLGGRYTAEVVAYDPASDGASAAEGDLARPIAEALRAPSAGGARADDLISGAVGPDALQGAAKAGDASAIARLVAAGADVERVRSGYTPLMTAAYYGRPAAVRALLAAGAKPKKICEGASAMHAALNGLFWDRARGDAEVLEILELLLAAKVPVDLGVGRPGTPLMAAALAGRSGLVKFLLSRGANPDAAARNGLRALHRAARSGDVATLDALLDAGADLHALTADGRNVLHVAVDFPGWNDFEQVDRSAMVVALLARGVSTTHVAADGFTPVEFARQNLTLGQLAPKERDPIATALGLPLDLVPDWAKK